MSALVDGLVLAGLAGGLAFILWLWRRIHVLELTRARVAEADGPRSSAAVPLPLRPFVRHHHLVPWLLALLVIGALHYGLHIPLIFAGTFGLVTGLLLGQLETLRVARMRLRIEEQLADAIDLMVATLRVGAGAMSALETATHEARAPLRAQLDELLGRIRLGDDPQAVLRPWKHACPWKPFGCLRRHCRSTGKRAAA